MGSVASAISVIPPVTRFNQRICFGRSGIGKPNKRKMIKAKLSEILVVIKK
jgi:hypothetical protein